jgi:parallel beta-helix repeat protein
VGATDNNDNVANFSNYGWWIDVVAPGVDIFSTWPGNNYKSLNGTSMAAPHVSGLAGLILSKNPGLSNEEVRQVFRVSAEDLGVSGWDEYFGYGRINAYNSLQLDSVCISRIDLGDVIQGTIDIIGTASGTEFDHYTVYYGEGIDPSNWTQIGMTSYGQVSEGTLASWDTTTVDDGQYMLKLVVVSSDSNEFVDRKVIVVDNEDLSYVPDDFSTIQSAIDGSADGDTVWVRSGTYLDSIDFSGKAIAVRSLNGPDVTIIDGDGVDFDTMVRFSSGEDENAILNGFTITNGNDSGIKCIMSSPRIADCIISGNSAKSGGGIYCEFSSPMIANCTISGNSCTGLGGGIYCYLSSPMITNCTMSGNSAKSGGGIYCGGYSSPSITNCTISGNSATTAIGGGLLFAESSPTISNCTISGNSAKGDGGGICCWSSSPMITNCTMSANSGDYGGGICSNLSSLSITNCTINGNSAAASNKGGGVFCWRSSLTVVNSILWGDTAGGSPNEIDLFQDCSIDITYSAIEGGWGTQEEMETNHNLAADPRLGPFSDLGWPRMGYFPLMVGSPAIDAGDDHYCPETDQRGQHRPMDGDGDGISICDIGAYEFTNERNNPSVAYNADNNRYLLVYDSASWSYPGKADICGQLTDYDGTPLGSEFVISGAVDDQRRPLVAYDSGNKRFLVVWTDLRNRESSSSDIYGQIVNGNGSLYGANLLISNAAKMQDRPTVAYDSVNRRFFVAWQDYRNKETTRYDVYGQIVDANGTLDGNEFVISDGSDNQTWPKAAYDSANERFLVVWSDYRNRQSTSYDIYGQILNADGTRYGGGELVIIVADRYQSSPSVAYDSVNQRFLVVWNDGRGGEITRCDIYGQILNASGATCGNDFVICDDLVIFAGEHQYEPSVAYDSVNQRFLVVWTDQRNIGTTGGYHVLGNTDIYGQRVKPDGTLLCGNFAISDAPDTQTYPTVAYNSENNNFLVAFNTHEIGPIEEVVPEIGFAVVRQPGDLDGDGDVDYDDYLLFRTAYGSCSGDGNFIPEADLDGDGCVTINDYRILRTLM